MTRRNIRWVAQVSILRPGCCGQHRRRGEPSSPKRDLGHPPTHDRSAVCYGIELELLRGGRWRLGTVLTYCVVYDHIQQLIVIGSCLFLDVVTKISASRFSIRKNKVALFCGKLCQSFDYGKESWLGLTTQNPGFVNSAGHSLIGGPGGRGLGGLWSLLGNPRVGNNTSQQSGNP
jgi:hypothetical protein